MSVRIPLWQGVWKPATEFHLRQDGPNNESRPFEMTELGADFFLRVRTTKLGEKAHESNPRPSKLQVQH